MAEEKKITQLGEATNYQINQLVKNENGELQYIVLHPETNAGVIIETEDKKVFTKEERETLANLVSLQGGYLTYKGQYSTTASYKVNDVAVYEEQFYVCKAETSGSFDESKWLKVNKLADKAKEADTIATKAADNMTADTYLTFVTANNAEADYEELRTAGGLKFNANNKTLTVDGGTEEVPTKVVADKFVGKATEAEEADLAKKALAAEKYVEYTYDGEGNRLTETGKTADISYAIQDLQQRIENVEGGGTTLLNSLFVSKDGGEAVEFDGSKDLTIDIKQTYSTADITDLLESTKTKIDSKWLPDTVLGQLEYQGTWGEAVASYTAEKGHYWIANKEVSVNPDGSAASAAYHVGDWAVYNGTAWDKIDNTDAVVTVNGQIGAVETYKGNWAAETKYFKGDTVNVNGTLYLCAIEHTSATDFVENSNWLVYGRHYTATDAIKIENNVIKHDVAVEAGSDVVGDTLAANVTFKIPVITRDAFGHVTKIDEKVMAMSSELEDTTREIQLNGNKILDGTGANRKKALNVKDSEYVNVAYENDALNFKHKLTNNGEVSYEVATVDASTEADYILYPGQGYSIPSFSIDTAGHIVSGGMKKVKLAESPFKHNHFEIVKEADGSQTIRAFKDIDNAEALNGLGALKFYQGAANPVATDVLKLNAKFAATELYQGANKVIDASAKIYAGNGYNAATGAFDRPLEGSFDAASNKFTMAETGVASGTYSAVYVNKHGLVTAGGQMVEFGTEKDADPSANLAVGGLYFRKLA